MDRFPPCMENIPPGHLQVVPPSEGCAFPNGLGLARRPHVSPQPAFTDRAAVGGRQHHLGPTRPHLPPPASPAGPGLTRSRKPDTNSG